MNGSFGALLSPVLRAIPLSLRRRWHYGWVVLGTVMAMVFALGGARESVTVFIRVWADQFKWDMAAVSLGLSINVFLMGVGGVAAGVLTDRFGPKKVIILFLLITTAGILGIAGMGKLWQLYVFFGVFIGVGTAVYPVITALIGRWFTRGRGQALGMVHMGDLMGLAVLGPAALSMAGAIGWRVPWLAIGGASILLILPLTILLVRTPPAGAGGGTKPSQSAQPLSGASVREAMRTSSLWMLMGSHFVCGFTARFFWLLLAPIAIEGGMSNAGVSLTVSIAGLTAIPGLFIFGMASDRFRRPAILSIDFALRAVAFAVLVLYLRSHQPFLMLLGAGMAGFLTRSTAPPFSIAMINCFGFRSLGKLLGITSVIHQLAGAGSIFLGGLAYDLTGSYTPILVASVVALIVGAVATWFIPERKCYS